MSYTSYTLPEYVLVTGCTSRDRLIIQLRIMSQGPLQGYHTIGSHDKPRPMGSEATAGLCKTLSAKLPYYCRKSVVDTSKLNISKTERLSADLSVALCICLYVSAK